MNRTKTVLSKDFDMIFFSSATAVHNIANAVFSLSAHTLSTTLWIFIISNIEDKSLVGKISVWKYLFRFVQKYIFIIIA